MDDDFDTGSYSSDTVDRIYLVRNLHRRLAGYYRAHIQDPKTVKGIWDRIETEEHILKERGFEVE